jgi:hypothetical protein
VKIRLSTLLAVICSGCVSLPERIHVGEKFSADQVYARRLEFSKMIVRAEFVWHYGFEKCTVYVPAEGGGFRFLIVDFDARKVSATSPKEWEIVQRLYREFRASMLAAIKNKDQSGQLAEFTMKVDADVEVILSPNDLQKDVIVVGRDLTMKVVTIHSIREEKG